MGGGGGWVGTGGGGGVAVGWWRGGVFDQGFYCSKYNVTYHKQRPIHLVRTGSPCAGRTLCSEECTVLCVDT